MRLSNKAVYILAICLFSNGVVAEKIYRSVDNKGEVTFSDEPPPTAVDVKQIDVKPAPTEAQHRESVERVERMESQANEMGAARAGRASRPAEQVPEEVQPTEVIQNYEDGNLSPYDRAQRREALQNRPGERPVQLPVHRPAQRPAARPAGGRGR